MTKNLIDNDMLQQNTTKIGICHYVTLIIVFNACENDIDKALLIGFVSELSSIMT